MPSLRELLHRSTATGERARPPSLVDEGGPPPSKRRADAREVLGAGLVGAEDHDVGDLHVLWPCRSVQHVIRHVRSHQWL